MNLKIVSVDSGKANTKVCAYDTNTSEIRTEIIATNVAKRNALVELCMKESQYIVSMERSDPEIYGDWMVGVIGGESSYSNSKKDMIHKIMTSVAIALVTENGDTVIPSIGCPLSVFSNGEMKADFYEYIFPDGRVDIKINGTGRYYYIEKEKGCVFPESFGALFMLPDHFEKRTGIIDIGGLNLNASYFDKGDLQPELCKTEKLGLFSIVSQLRNRLNAYCDASFNDRDIEIFLKMGYVDGYEKTDAIIDKVLTDHLSRIAKVLKDWDIASTDLIFIGGTAKLMEKHICEEFSDKTYIPDDADFINCKGFLKAMIEMKGYNCPF